MTKKSVPRANKSDQAPDGLTLKESLMAIEKIVEDLEDGEIPLEDALQRFEQGMKLIEQCQDKLTKVEKKLKILTRDKSGEFSLSEE